MSALSQAITQWRENVRHDQSGRAKRYDNIDGTGELFFGLMYLGFALLGWLQSLLPAHSIWKTNLLLNLLFMYLVLGPALGLGFLTQRFVKRRYTWRRTGYVKLGAPGLSVGKGTAASDAKTRRLRWQGWISISVTLGVIAAVIGAGLAGYYAYLMKHPDALNLALAGYVFYLAVWPLMYAFLIWFMGRGHRWKWGLLAVMALGLIVIGVRGSGHYNYTEVSRPVILYVGSVWVLSGVITLVLYLRHNPPPAPEAE